MDVQNKAASFAAGAAASVLLAATPAFAASVKLGSDSGGLVFDPSTVTIKKGEKVTWTNNAGFPPQEQSLFPLPPPTPP